MRFILGTLLALSFAGSALSQNAPPPLNPANLALARQIFEAGGGSRRIDQMMDSMFGTIAQTLSTGQDAATQKVFASGMDDFRNEMRALTPKIVDISAEEYARALTEQELRDDLAFVQSPSGRAIMEKAPQIQQASMARMMPFIFDRLPSMMAKMTDQACDQQHCTAGERAQAQAVTKQAISSLRR